MSQSCLDGPRATFQARHAALVPAVRAELARLDEVAARARWGVDMDDAPQPVPVDATVGGGDRGLR